MASECAPLGDARDGAALLTMRSIDLIAEEPA